MMGPSLGPPMAHDGPKLGPPPKLWPPIGHDGPKLGPPIGHDGPKLGPAMGHDGPKLGRRFLPNSRQQKPIKCHMKVRTPGPYSVPKPTYRMFRSSENKVYVLSYNRLPIVMFEGGGDRSK